MRCICLHLFCLTYSTFFGMKPVSFLILIVLTLSSCAPTIVVRVKNQSPPANENEKFIVFGVNDKFDIKAIRVGEIKIRDAGLAVNCSYKSVVDLAKKRARDMGANCLKINEHKVPDIWSTCHRIKATAYRIDDETLQKIKQIPVEQN
jgi:hypothetical protein